MLSTFHKNALCQAISSSIASAGRRGFRATQRLLCGFKNYLTKQDREALCDEKQHPFARLSIVVEGMVSIRLFMPCEKTLGHIAATVSECYGLAHSPPEKHALLEDLKRQLKRLSTKSA